MPERGPLGFKRPLSIGPMTGKDAIVSVRMEGKIEDKDATVNMIADAVASVTNDFLEFGQGTNHYQVSQAPVRVGEPFDHFNVMLYYPDSRISMKDVRAVRNELQKRTDRAESLNIMRV